MLICQDCLAMTLYRLQWALVLGFLGAAIGIGPMT